MDQKIIEFNKGLKVKKVPDLQVGDVVRVHKKIKEGEKERVQIFKGLIIAIKAKQSSSPTITIRRESQGVGVEMIFPIYLPTIEKIEVLRHSKVRRSKLYYMRGRSGKSAKMKVREISEKEKSKDLKDEKISPKKEVDVAEKKVEIEGAEIKKSEEEKTVSLK